MLGVVLAAELRRLGPTFVAGFLKDRRDLGVGGEVLPALLIPLEEHPDPVVLIGIAKDVRTLGPVLLSLLSALGREDLHEAVEILDLRRCQDHVSPPLLFSALPLDADGEASVRPGRPGDRANALSGANEVVLESPERRRGPATDDARGGLPARARSARQAARGAAVAGGGRRQRAPRLQLLGGRARTRLDAIISTESGLSEALFVALVWSRCGPGAQSSPQTRSTTRSLYLFV